MPHETSKPFLIFVLLVTGVALKPSPSLAVQLTPETARAFDKYVASEKSRASPDVATKHNFLYIDSFSEPQQSEAYAKLKAGEIFIQPRATCDSPACTHIPGGLIHDWIGIVFVPGVSLSQTLSTLQDYNRDSAFYPKEVVRSELLSQSGDDFHIYLRLKQVHVITVVLDTEYDVHYEHLDSSHVYAISHSTRVAEVDHAGTPNEREEPMGNDHGFLWRLNSYWRFWEANGGVYVQVEAISLTRDVPAGLGWLIGSFIESIPESSVRSTLAETRSALLTQLNLAKENCQ